jgi:tRNA(Ile)-lysidine synthase
MSSGEVVKQVREYFEVLMVRHDLLRQQGERLVVAVSGGPDSLALLHLIAKQGIRPPASLVVAHLDHGLRPSSADEAEKVANLARNWGLRCHIRRVGVKEVAREQRTSLEEAGRLARYRFLSEVAHQEGAKVVATGHNADDQVETILLHLLRGSGTRGLQGMRDIARLPGADDLHLIRPILGMSRVAVELYCREYNLEPAHDESNLDPQFLRNRIRHELLPTLERFSPGVRQGLLQLAAIAQGDHDLLDVMAARALTGTMVLADLEVFAMDLSGWRQLPLALRRETLRRAVAEVRRQSHDLGFRPLERARMVAEAGQVGAQSELPGGVVLEIGYQTLTLSGKLARAREPSAGVEEPQLSSDAPKELAIPSIVSLGRGWLLEVQEAPDVELPEVEANPDRWTAYLDADQAGRLLLRPRRAGERFQPLGMGGRTVSLKEMMIDLKIPSGLRRRWPILANHEHLLWLAGYRLDERARVTDQSRRVIRIWLSRGKVAA